MSLNRLDPGMSFLATTELRCCTADLFGEAYAVGLQDGMYIDVPPSQKKGAQSRVFSILGCRYPKVNTD